MPMGGGLGVFSLKFFLFFFYKARKNIYKLQKHYKANIYAVLFKSNLIKTSEE